MVHTDDITLSRAQRILACIDTRLDEHVYECDQCIAADADFGCTAHLPVKPCSEGIWLDHLRTKWYRHVAFLKHVAESRAN